MRLKEIIAGALVVLIIFGLPVGAFIGNQIYKGPDVIDVYLRAHENGGFSPNRIELKKGEPVKMRLIAEDVTHGFFIGELGIDAGKIEPGKPVTIEFTPQKIGEIGFVCSIICSPLHTRLRGTLVITE